MVEGSEVLGRYGYDAWGNLTECEEKVKNRFRFCGEMQDPISQQYYLRARYYNPVIGRFIQEDTYRGDGLNLYAYCANNPVNYVDPSGHWCEAKQDIYGKQKAEAGGFGEQNSTGGRNSPLNSQEQNIYDAARARGVGAAEAYYIATGRSPLNQAGNEYMVQREQQQIMDYYQNSTTLHYNTRKGTGTSQQVGTWTHKDVAHDMNYNYIPNNKQNLPYIKDIYIEQNYYNGRQYGYNKKGSSRLDIAITNNINNNVHIGDIKTGNALYTNSQKNKNERNMNGFDNHNGYTFTHQEIKP